MHKLTPEQIRAEVTRFWTAFTSKQPDALEDFYAHESTGFGSASTRPEPGRLAAARRRREYFSAATQMRYVLGDVDVTLIGDNVAVASYTFRFHATRVHSGLNPSAQEDIENGRATQVFAVDSDGQPRIFHEHFSLPAK